MNTTKHSFILAGTIIISMILWNCREITTTTKIYSDGSCERTVKVKSKHKSHSNSYFPIPTDSTWTITNTKTRQDTTFYEFTATREFRDVKDLQRVYTSYADSGLAIEDLEMKKRFGLFYLYFRYQEVYSRYSPYDKVPISDYLTEDEIQIYLSEQDSSDIEDKVDEWRARAMFEELFQAMVSKAETLAIPELTPAMFRTNKDTLFRAIIKNADSTNGVLREASVILKTDAVSALTDTIDYVIKRIDHDLENMMQVSSNEYVNQVIMPGLLLDTNADAVEGNMARWKFSGEAFEFRDKRMWGESRVINWWGIGISGGLLLLLLGFLVIIARARRP